MDQRPLIGIITARASAVEQRQLLSGVLRKAHEMGADTAVFTNLYNFEEYFAGTEVENRIYDLVSSERLSGLILTAESILNPELQQYIYQRITARGVPLIVTGADLPGLDCLNNDVTADFEDITRHLVEVHGITDIDFLTGYQHIDTSHQRVQGCRNVLAAHGAALPEDRVIYGDFWMNSGEKLALDYIEGRRRIPKALLCANDYMAYGVCDKLLEHGVAVPDTLTVIGYEFVGGRCFHSPVLTTYRRNREAIGEQAVEWLMAKLRGQSFTPEKVVGSIVCGGSCACGADRRQLSEELAETRESHRYLDLNFHSNFEQQLTVCRSLADLIHVLQEFVYLVRDVCGVYLCLYEDWCSSGEAPVHADDSPMLCYRVMSPHEIPSKPVMYLRSDLFPDKLPGADDSEFLYFVPLFFGGRDMGFFILQYREPDVFDPIFGDWIRIAASGLESLRMKNDMRTLLECQSLSEHHDTTTGLLNRSGFYHELRLAQQQAGKDDRLMLVVVRTALFTDDTSIDEKKRQVSLDREVADRLAQALPGQRGCCAKLGDRMFAVGLVGDVTEEDAALTGDRLATLILHAPKYSDLCGEDTLVYETVCLPAAETDPEAAVKRMTGMLGTQIKQLADVRRRPGFQVFYELHNALYRSPAEEWSAQQCCRDFHLSYGHFCVTYKDLFGISFHQDVIRSRVAMAKYLLITSNVSISAVAIRCGYTDEKYFLRQFRQSTGMTPHSYRSR
ncbi:MAG: substrate-binding domain-containing protein [Oscillospiraceae bacterium]|nr:substrate-binding domain-containing protein [Oscillospiraceae bacterium]